IESWAIKTPDHSECEAPERGHAPLSTLVRAWPAAPGCLRAALRERLNQQIERMATCDCFCAARKPALASVRKNADLLKKLTDTRGSEFAGVWVQTVVSPDTRFNCHPS